MKLDDRGYRARSVHLTTVITSDSYFNWDLQTVRVFDVLFLASIVYVALLDFSVRTIFSLFNSSNYFGKVALIVSCINAHV